MLERDQGHLLIQEVALAVHEGLAGSERDRPTLRDRFAMAALRCAWEAQSLDSDLGGVAECAYQFADAMLEARERTGWRTLRCESCEREVRLPAGEYESLPGDPPCPWHEDGDSPCLRPIEVQG